MEQQYYRDGAAVLQLGPPGGAHCLLLAPGLRCGTGTVCGARLPGVRECMPMATTSYQPTQPVPQGNQTGQSPLGRGRCGWGGLLAVLTAILGRGSTVVGGNQDVVRATGQGQAARCGLEIGGLR
jgi:hypothetical protein